MIRITAPWSTVTIPPIGQGINASYFIMVFVDTPSNRSYLGEYNYQEFYAALSQAREALKDTDDPADNVSAYEIRSII
jgi:hypothetical protein